jgi:hypothetical protein
LPFNNHITRFYDHKEKIGAALAQSAPAEETYRVVLPATATDPTPNRPVNPMNSVDKRKICGNENTLLEA